MMYCKLGGLEQFMYFNKSKSNIYLYITAIVFMCTYTYIQIQISWRGFFWFHAMHQVHSIVLLSKGYMRRKDLGLKHSFFIGANNVLKYFFKKK